MFSAAHRRPLRIRSGAAFRRNTRQLESGAEYGTRDQRARDG